MRNVFRKRRHSRQHTTICILFSIIVILCVVIGIIFATYFSQMRLNQFSKNIILSENYFLRNYGFPRNSDDTDDSKRTAGFTYNEAAKILDTLLSKSGFEIENAQVFMRYRPYDTLNKTDIYAYYYNALLRLIPNHMPISAFLFSPQIRSKTEADAPEDVSIYTTEALLTQLDHLIRESFIWHPDAIYIQMEYGEVQQEYDDRYLLDYEVPIESESYRDDTLILFTDTVIETAEALLSNNSAYQDEYDEALLCRLYFDSLSRQIFGYSEHVMTPSEISECLWEDPEHTITPTILDVPHISQLPEYPNGCEAVSAVMLLQYEGYDISKNIFIEEYLEKGAIKNRFGVRFGPDPQEKYAGDPSSKKGGWGCFAPVIVNALNKYLAEQTHMAQNVSGASLEILCEHFIDRGIPVSIWITQDYLPIDEVYQWLDTDDKTVHLYPKNQHCVVLSGYDKYHYYICDPLSNTVFSAVKKIDLEQSYASMGAQAVTVVPLVTDAKDTPS